jgi:hypothetical protein
LRAEKLIADGYKKIKDRFYIKTGLTEKMTITEPIDQKPYTLLTIKASDNQEVQTKSTFKTIIGNEDTFWQNNKFSSMKGKL